MKRLLVALAAVAAMAAVIVPAAMAAPSDQAAPGTGWGCPMWGYGGYGSGAQANIDYSQIPMWKTLGDKLGMNPNDLVKELQGGKSVADVASEKNVSEQTLIDALMAPQIDFLKLRVQYGYMTQDQANAAQQAQAAGVKSMLEQKGFGGGYGWGGYGYGMGPGMMWGHGYGPGGYGMMGGYW